MTSPLDKFRLKTEPSVSESVTDSEKVVSPSRLTLLQKLGKSREGLPEGHAPLIARGASYSEDLHRILALPRRARPSDGELAAVAASLEARLGTGAVTCQCATRFKKHCCRHALPLQAWALAEIERFGGLLGPIGVGHGKTLLDLLAAMVLPGCKKAVLLLPANLKPQLLDFDWHYYGQHWKLPNLAGGKWFHPGRPLLHVIAYTQLQTAKNTNLLEEINPDTLILDEGHQAAGRTARGIRVERYMSKHPETRYLTWSGTLVKRKLKDYSSHSTRALKAGSPTPAVYTLAEQWGKVLDPGEHRTAPGDLLRFCKPGQLVADAYREWVVNTPGVVSSGDAGGCDASVLISELKVTTPPKVAALLSSLEETAERPDGEQLVDVMSVASAARQLSCGFYYKWRWPRGEADPVKLEWLRVRKEWHKELRERLHHATEFMDSPLLLTKAAIRWHDGYWFIQRDEEGKELERRFIPPKSKTGPYKTWNSRWWPEWKAVRHTAKPETEPVWVDDFLVKACAEWLSAKPGLMWYEFSAFAKAVAAACPTATFCGPGDEGNEKVLRLTGKESCIISIRAHGTGKNLQVFNRNLIANPPSAGDVSEQLLGRTHRNGQTADEVTFEYFRHTKSMIAALEKARELSEFISVTFGAKQILADKATFLF